MALIGIKRLGEFLQKKESEQSNRIGRLCDGDVEDLFTALGLSPNTIEGDCLWRLDEGPVSRERELPFRSLILMGLKEP